LIINEDTDKKESISTSRVIKSSDEDEKDL
jgi:hypothetical protein